MPEYLAPGVYVEETSFRPKTIEGVSTSTAGFVGPARFGPVEGEPELLTSFADFERTYGGLDPLAFEDTGEQTNYLAHGVRAFFEEGGRRCYVSRIYQDPGDGGRASSDGESPPRDVRLEARFPGAAGNLRVTFTPSLSENLLLTDPITGAVLIRGARENDTVYLTTGDSPPGAYLDLVRQGEELVLRADDGSVQRIADLDVAADRVSLLSVNVQIERPIIRPRRPGQRYEAPEFLEGFLLNPTDPRSLAGYFTEAPASRRLALTVPFSIGIATSEGEAVTGIDYAQALFGATPDPAAPTVITLTDGSDGNRPSSPEYQGRENPATKLKSGLASLEDVEDVSIVAAPGYSFGYNPADDTEKRDIEATQAYLIGHAERMKYRIAVLDAPEDQSITDVRAWRGKLDSKYAALYYPWVTVFDPVREEELDLPPSGFVSGIYARNDIERGVQKAPANEVVRLAVGFEFMINRAQQEALNPDGINCFRFFEGRGYRLWGARTATSDGEWKYVNLRRYFAYLERSIDKGTQVFVFESNAERLWANVRRTVEDFLFNEWKSARLMGVKPEEAYFVRCDRSTMTQNDIDNGRLICLIGVAPLRPAEFVIFRIGQKLLETRG